MKKFGETLGGKTEVEKFEEVQKVIENTWQKPLRLLFTRGKDWSERFPNMVLSTEYSEAVNARCTFQPLWVSGGD